MRDWFVFVLVLSAMWTLFKLAQYEHKEHQNRKFDAWVRHPSNLQPKDEVEQ